MAMAKKSVNDWKNSTCIAAPIADLCQIPQIWGKPAQKSLQKSAGYSELIHCRLPSWRSPPMAIDFCG
jgi:hypothetical protein